MPKCIYIYVNDFLCFIHIIVSQQSDLKDVPLINVITLPTNYGAILSLMNKGLCKMDILK